MSARALADAIVLVHGAFIVFVVGGLPAIWIGLARGSAFATSRAFRGAHLGAILFVVAESLLGYACPLTVWEDALRGRTTGEGFIARAMHAWMFWSWPPWVFTTLYLAFGALVAWTWWRYPPRARR